MYITLGIIPNNGGQILKQFLLDNDVDLSRFSVNSECDNEYTKIRKKIRRLVQYVKIIDLTVKKGIL